MFKSIVKILLAITFISMLISCGEDEVCYDCILATTQEDVCTSTYEEQAARNDLDVNSLEEYIDAISRTGFTCTLIPQ